MWRRVVGYYFLLACWYAETRGYVHLWLWPPVVGLHVVLERRWGAIYHRWLRLGIRVVGTVCTVDTLYLQYCRNALHLRDTTAGTTTGITGNARSGVTGVYADAMITTLTWGLHATLAWSHSCGTTLFIVTCCHVAIAPHLNVAAPKLRRVASLWRYAVYAVLFIVGYTTIAAYEEVARMQNIVESTYARVMVTQWRWVLTLRLSEWSTHTSAVVTLVGVGLTVLSSLWSTAAATIVYCLLAELSTLV